MKQEDEKEKKFISLLSDTTFKHFFKIEDYKEFFNTIIKPYTNMDISEFRLYDTEFNSSNEKRDYRLDILLESDKYDLIILIEMNRFPSKEIKYRNKLFVYTALARSLNSGEDIKKKKVIQINFNKEKHPYVSKCSFYLMDKVTNREIKDFEIYEVYLENYKGIRYNGDNKEEAYLSLFTATSYEELREIAGDDKEALKIVDELERLGLNDKFGLAYDNEMMQKKMINTARNWGYDDGKEEGLEEGKKAIAKNFLKDGIPIEVVSKNTGLSVEELEIINKEA